jgi:hypothetical protein
MVTTTFPVVAPLGTGTAMLVALQLVGEPATPLNVTVLVPCVVPKFVPVITTDVPIGPDVGFRLVIVGVVGAGVVTVKLIPLLGTPPTFTTTFPGVAPAGTDVVMLVALQLGAGVVVPLNATVLVPCVVPKFVPVIVTAVPLAPEFGVRLVMVGDALIGMLLPPLHATRPKARAADIKSTCIQSRSLRTESHLSRVSTLIARLLICLPI